MPKPKFFVPLAILALLGACEVKVGDEADKERSGTAGAGAAAATAEGKAQEGSISIDAPGFDLKLNIPDAIRSEIGADGDVLYPGSKLSGLHVQANETNGGNGEESVELRFTTGDAPAKVAAWYRDPARAQELNVASAEQQGQGYRIAGTSKGDGDPFTLTLTPAAGGGTEGRIILQDRAGR